MFIGNTLSSETGIILAIDGPVADLLQRPASAIVDRSYLEFTHRADQVRNARDVARIKVGSRPQLIRKRYVRADGSAVWVDLHVSRFGGGVDAGRLVGSFQISDAADRTKNPEIMRKMAMRLLALGRLRAAEFGDHLFVDHAWGVLLHIYLAEAEGRLIDVAALVALVRLEPRVVLRWIGALQTEGLVEGADQSGDLWQLSADGARRVELLLTRFAGGEDGAAAWP